MLTIQPAIMFAPYTTFGIGGPADFFTIASNEEELIEAVAWAKEKNVPFFILGSGANILVGDKGYRGLVIKNEAKKTLLNGSLLTAESGAVITDLIDMTVVKGLSGLEHYAGIPSTLGGALWQNLHFLSPDRSKTVYIGDLVIGAKILTEDGTIQHVKGDYFNFAYDWSILHKKKDVVLSATLELTPENPAVLLERVKANILWRDTKHPDNAAKCSAGSVFKKIEGYGAGRLIEQVGLKGKMIGGAKISERHANFILNEKNATAKDVMDLIALVKQKVKDELGLAMETEISMIGEF